MARRRMIDPNFWQSENVARLAIRQRLLLIGLISNADDEGKLRGNPAFVRSIIFPYEDYTLSDIEDDLTNIESIGTILRYEIDGNNYILMLNWKKFQRVDKPQKSMIPDPLKNTSDKKGDNHSENDSKNDSKNEDEINSGAKERKGKEDKEKGKEDEEKRSSPSSAQNNPFTFFEENGFGTISPMITDGINYWMDGNFFDEPNEIILKAMVEAVSNNARTWKYVEAILKNWSSKNLRKVRDVDAHLKSFEANKYTKVNIKSKSDTVPDYIANQPQQDRQEDVDEEKRREIDELLRELGEIK